MSLREALVHPITIAAILGVLSGLLLLVFVLLATHGLGLLFYVIIGVVFVLAVRGNPKKNHELGGV